MLPEAFSTYACEYDKHFTNTLIGKLQRRRVYTYLDQIIGRHSHILELNCGTGEDAIYMSKSGHSIIASDISEGMVKVAISKAKGKKTEFRICPIQEILSLKSEGPFDLVVSNFGGLNCLNKQDIINCASDLNLLTKTGSYLFLVIMGRKCIWERLYFTLKGDKDKANRRLSGDGVPTKINGELFQTYYYSPQEIKRIFGTYFKVEYVRPIGLFIPPSYLSPFFRNKIWCLHLLYFIENIAGRLSLPGDYSDHYTIVFRKKD